jgi:hypothetical protein
MERDDAVEAARVAVHAHEAVCEDAARPNREIRPANGL